VIDDDLGVSVAAPDSRKGFARLVTEVTMGRAGIVLGIEMVSSMIRIPAPSSGWAADHPAARASTSWSSQTARDSRCCGAGCCAPPPRPASSTPSDFGEHANFKLGRQGQGVLARTKPLARSCSQTALRVAVRVFERGR
jgi:hypothetical protein